MRIGITTAGCDGGKSGISQYLIHLLRAMAELEPAFEAEVIVCEAEKDIFVPEAPHIRPFLNGAAPRSPAPDLLWHQTLLPALCARRGYDVLFLPAANRRVAAFTPCPAVGTVHDFSSIHMDAKYDPLRHFYITRVLPWFVRRLDHAISVSECTKADIVGFAGVPGGRVTVIPHGVGHAIYHPREPEAARARLRVRYPLRKPYLLYIARIEHPGKNHVRLIRAFRAFKQRTGFPHQLVLAGSDWSRAGEVHAEARAADCGEDILFTGFVPGGDLPDFYCGAEAFVFPSLFEGFGMPILEAMACGVPVACSGVSSLPEVAGDAALFFDPASEEEIAGCLERIAGDAVLRDQLRERGIERAAGFTWTAAARRTLATLAAAARA